MEKIPKEILDQHLSSYFHAEKKGSELIARLVDFAPGEKEKDWINIWSKEEEHHHRLWDAVAQGRNFTPKNIDNNVAKLFEITEDYVNQKNWAGSMIGAAVIEHLSNAAASILFHDADDDMKRVFKKITGDDLGHLDFDIHQIKNVIQTESGRREVIEIHKRFLREVIEWPLRKETTDIDIEILNEAYRLHRDSMRKIGLKLPNMHFSRKFSFKIKRGLLKAFIS
jgi:hypothetical protein